MRDYFVRHTYPVPKDVLVIKRQRPEELTKDEIAAASAVWLTATGTPVRELDLPLPPQEQGQVEAWLATHDCRYPEKRRWASWTVRPRMRVANPRPQGDKNLARRVKKDVHEIVRDHVRGKLRAMPYLSREEEAALVAAALAGDVKARDRIVLAHMRLAMRTARGTWQNDGVELDDKISAGALGLLAALDTFDPDRNVPFGHHAKWHIKNAIRDHALSEASPVREPRPKDKRLRFGRVSFDAPVRDGLGGDKVVGTVLTTLGAPARGAEAGWEGYHALDSRAWNAFEPEAAVLDAIERQTATERRALLGRAMQALTPREQEIFAARVLADEPVKLAELAGRFGVSVERIRQIDEKARKKIERFIKAEIAAAQSKQEANMRQRRAGYWAARICAERPCASVPRQSHIPRSPAAWHAPDVIDPRKDAGAVPRCRLSPVPPAPKGQKLRLAAPLRTIARMRLDAHLRRIAPLRRRDTMLDRLGIPSLDLATLCGDALLGTRQPELLAA